MATITIRQNRWEDSATIELENGQVIEAAIIHLPGSGETTFALGTYDSHGENIEDSYQELFTCPVQAA